MLQYSANEGYVHHGVVMKLSAGMECWRDVGGAGSSADEGNTGVAGGVGSLVGSDGIMLFRRQQGKLPVGGTLCVELSSNIGRDEWTQ